MNLLPSREDIDYVPFYCEENVWRLLARLEFRVLRCWALLVTGPSREVLFLRQRAGRPIDGLIRWDYHVMGLAENPSEGLMALDPDSDLPFPCPVPRYLEASFPENIQAGLSPRFRVVRGADYVAGLVSDRSHMIGPDGKWKAPPPPWPSPGSGRGEPNNLMAWTDMGRRRPGRVMDLEGLLAFAAPGGRRRDVPGR